MIIIIIIEFCQKRANDKVGVGLLLVCSVGGAPFAVSLLALKIIMPKAQLTCFGEHFSVQHNKLTQHPSCNVSLPREREAADSFEMSNQRATKKFADTHPISCADNNDYSLRMNDFGILCRDNDDGWCGTLGDITTIQIITDSQQPLLIRWYK